MFECQVGGRKEYKCLAMELSLIRLVKIEALHIYSSSVEMSAVSFEVIAYFQKFCYDFVLLVNVYIP